MVLIESVNNKIIKHIKALDTKKGRDKHNSFIIEGEKFVNSIPSNWCVQGYFLSQSAANVINIHKYSSKAQVYIIKDSIFNAVSDTATPQGIFAICTKVNYTLNDILDKKTLQKPLFILMAQEVSDPGNLGTVIRTAESAGVSGVVVSQNCADTYSKKVIRATAGAIFHTPIVQNSNLLEVCKTLKSMGVQTVSAHLKGTVYPYDLDLTKDYAIIIGNEGKGLPDEIIKNTDQIIKIPMLGSSDSLNVSVAGSILIYEVVRQRLKMI